MKYIANCLFFLALAIGVQAQYAYQPPFAQGHVMAPEFSYFNKDCSRVLTISKADAIVWDIASGKPVYKANLTASIRKYNPYDKRWFMYPVPSPDLTLLIIELVPEGGDKQAFLFDMKTGKLSVDDGLFNDKIMGFTPNGDYVAMHGLRTPGKNPNLYLQTYIPAEGSKTAVSIQGIKNFAPVGFSYDGKAFYGKNMDNNKFIVYDPTTGKSENTKLKYDDKTKYFFYYKTCIYTSKWLQRVPVGENWKESFYNVDTRKVVQNQTKNGLSGPYNFSDDGRYGIYFLAENNKEYLKIKDMASDKEVSSFNSHGGSVFIQLARIPESSPEKFYVLNKSGKAISVFNFTNPEPVKTVNMMADENIIKLFEAGMNSIYGVEKIEEEAKADFDMKNFLVNFPPIEHFSVNLSTAHTLKGHDITHLPFTQQLYTNGLGNSIRVKSVLALGKVSDCNGGAILLGVTRAMLNNKEDRSMFFINKLDANGKSTAFEVVGLISKGVNGGQFLATVDLGVYVANGKAAIVSEQKYHEGTKTYKTVKRTLMIDQSSCVITEQNKKP